MKRFLYKVILVCYALFLSITNSLAQPVNQTCDAAIILNCTSGPIDGTTIGVSNINIGAGSCTNNNLGVWYKIPGDGSVATVVTSALGANWDFKMIIFSGTCASKTLLSCVDVSGSGTSETATFQTITGTDYLVYVTNYNSSNTITGEFRINYTCTSSTTPTNTSCTNATALTCGTSNLAGSTFGATESTGISPNCATKTGVWYSFVGNGQNTQISTNSISNWDHAISVYSGNCAALNLLACVNSNSAGLNKNESHTLATVVGTTYYVFVSSASAGTNPSGNFNISLTCVNAPPNQFCAQAIDLPCGTSNLAGTTIGGLPSTLPSGLCSISKYGAWYTFTGDGTNTTISTTTSGYDIKMLIFSGSCTSATQIVCQDGLSNGTETFSFNTTNGLQYFVFIAHYSSTSTVTGNFQISRTCTVLPPPNDACSDASSLTCGTNLNQTTFNAELNPTISGHCGNRYGVWYKVTGTGQLMTVFSKATSGWNHVMSVFAGTCDNLILMACKNTAGTNGTETHSFVSEVGQTYYVFVSGDDPNSNAMGTFTISHRCQAAPDGGLSTLSGSTCSASLPFCSDQSYYFPNMVDAGVGQAGANYGCISTGSTHNPVWYYMKVSQSGTLIINLDQNDAGGGGSDVDYVLWGPFPNELTACTQIAGGIPPIQTGFKATGQETVGIGSQGGSYLSNTNCIGVTTPPNAIEGETYVIMITNYSNRPGFITFNQIGGSGLTDCSIVVLGDILDFSASNYNTSNRLKWKVEREFNVYSYRVKRSADGVNWQVIDVVIPKNNSGSTVVYTTDDVSFRSGDNYYQIETINFSGESKLSEILHLNNGIDVTRSNVKILNLIGQEVSEDYQGIKIYHFDDGTVIKHQ